MKTKIALLLATVSTAVWPVLASAATTAEGSYVITNGSDDGDIAATLDPFGASNYVLYDPVGPIGARDPVYYSAAVINTGNGLSYLAGSSSAELISQTENQLVTSFSVGALGFTLTQTVQDTFEGTTRTGSILTQTYAITNTSDAASVFSMLRYFDGDLYFNDSTLADGGGVLQQNGQLVLFETDASGSANDNDTFVGITAAGGTQAGYAVQQCCGIHTYPLPNTVDGDTNGDNFVDTAYDVTLQLQRDFNVAAGQTQYFTTTTLFGNGVPPAPGSQESLPLIDENPTTNAEGVQVYSFDIPENYQPQRVIWIDPIVAVGYVYAVNNGATFFSVTAPSLASVNDTDGYTLTFGSTVVALLAGQTYVFGAGVNSFTLNGINPALGLDPNNPTAFVTGIALNAIQTGSTVLTMTPIEQDYNTPLTPLPASIWLMVAGMGGLASLRRRKI